MSDIIQLKRGRYKGVDFLFTEATNVGGNRIIKFNYPGSSKQSIEVQGAAPPAYALTIWIQHENYFQNRADLIRVLTDGKVDTLTHPTDGAVANVINGPYQLTEKITELGRASLTVTFEVDDAQGIPVASQGLASQVGVSSGLLNSQLVTDFGNVYEVSSNLAGNFSDALENTTDAIVSISEASQVLTPLTDGISQFRASIIRVTNAVGDLIQTPDVLAEEIDGLFADLRNLYASPRDASIVFQSMFDFGASDPVVASDTVARVQRNENRDTMRTAIRVKALSYTYLSAAEDTYESTDALDTVQALLEAQYVDSRDNQLLTNEASEQLDRLRIQALDALDTARVTTRTTITIETPLIPLSVLVYRYYGSTELVDQIAELNNIKQNAFVEGELRILTA